jgi:CubicO group peptidase (beta-lactamase class C family)
VSGTFFLLSYGLGWGLYWSPYGEAFFKEGHDEGWRHYVVCFDKPKTGILIMTNSSNGEDLYSGLLENLIRDTFTPLEWEGFKSLCDDHAYFVIPSGARNLALGIFRAVRDSSSPAAPRNDTQTGVFTQTLQAVSGG